MSRYYLIDFKYHEFFHHYAVQLVLDFLHAPNDKSSGVPFLSVSGHWPLLQVSWGSVSCVP